MLNTLGDVVTCATAIVAVLIVPAALVRVWWPVLKARFAEWFLVPLDEEPVKPFPPLMSPLQEADSQTAQTDEPDRLSVSAADRLLKQLEVDRTRERLIEVLLYTGWTIGDLRRERILRGDNNEISAEVEAARRRLGIEREPRDLKVRDEKGERVISY